MKGKRRGYILENSYFVLYLFSSQTANREEWKIKKFMILLNNN